MKLTKSGLWIPRRDGVLPETAPRPHLITIILGSLSPVIGIVAVVVSLQSFKTARQALETSQQSLKIGQRAYLSVLAVEYADARIQIHLKNSGNTPARILPLGLRVVAIGETRFFGLQNDWFQGRRGLSLDDVNRLSKNLTLINRSSEIAGKEDGWLSVACDARYFTDGLPDSIAVAGLIQYRDVFDNSHHVVFGWRMKSLQVVGELGPFAAETLLASRFPGVVEVTPNEEILEYEPKALGSPK